MEMDIDVGGATALGRRSENQDRWAVAADGCWAAVSDGVGGAPGGALAATITIDSVTETLSAAAPIPEVFAQAHVAVGEAQRQSAELGRMAATLTVAVRVGGSRWLVAGAGDSPAFLLDSSMSTHRVLALHTLADELVDSGRITAPQGQVHPGRHTITRGIGHHSSATPDVVEVDVPVGAALVLASDGIDSLRPDQLAPIVASAASASSAAVALVDAALAAGARDNVTAVVVRPFVSSKR
jgi:protein phosphatase